MTATVPLEIQRMTKIDAASANRLRTFDLEWRCGSQFILEALKAGCQPEVIGAALRDCLASYQRMCLDGISDYIRLRMVLSHVIKILGASGNPPAPNQILAWCEATRVPEPIREYLING